LDLQVNLSGTEGEKR